MLGHFCGVCVGECQFAGKSFFSPKLSLVLFLCFHYVKLS